MPKDDKNGGILKYITREGSSLGTVVVDERTQFEPLEGNIECGTAQYSKGGMIRNVPSHGGMMTVLEDVLDRSLEMNGTASIPCDGKNITPSMQENVQQDKIGKQESPMVSIREGCKINKKLKICMNHGGAEVKVIQVSSVKWGYNKKKMMYMNQYRKVNKYVCQSMRLDPGLTSQQTEMMEKFGEPVNICGTSNRSVGHMFSGESIKNSDKFESERI